MMTMNIVVGYY